MVPKLVCSAFAPHHHKAKRLLRHSPPIRPCHRPGYRSCENIHKGTKERRSWLAWVPPQHLHHEWLAFKEQLKVLNDFKFSRHVLPSQPVTMQIRAFSDAPEKSYGAAIYIRSIDQQAIIRVRLLCAKSQIAPLKQTILPKLKNSCQACNRFSRPSQIRYWP